MELTLMESLCFGAWEWGGGEEQNGEEPENH